MIWEMMCGKYGILTTMELNSTIPIRPHPHPTSGSFLNLKTASVFLVHGIKFLGGIALGRIITFVPGFIVIRVRRQVFGSTYSGRRCTSSLTESHVAIILPSAASRDLPITLGCGRCLSAPSAAGPSGSQHVRLSDAPPLYRWSTLRSSVVGPASSSAKYARFAFAAKLAE